MNTQEFSSDPAGPQRPVFLHVLCILSFVMAGTGILYYGFTAVMAFSGLQEKSFEDMKAVGMLEESANMQKVIYWGKINALVSMVAELFSLAGVLLMWKLRKAGFYVYAVAEIIPLGLMYYVTWLSASMFSHMKFPVAGMDGNPMAGMMLGMSLASVAIMGLFDVGFIIMYALNLKHMK